MTSSKTNLKRHNISRHTKHTKHTNEKGKFTMSKKAIEKVIAGVNTVTIKGTVWVRMKDVLAYPEGTDKYYPGCLDERLRIFNNRKAVKDFCDLNMKWYHNHVYLDLKDVKAYIEDREAYNMAHPCKVRYKWNPKEAAVITLLTGLIVSVKVPAGKAPDAVKVMFKNDTQHRELYLKSKTINRAARKVVEAIKNELNVTVKDVEGRLNG